MRDQGEEREREGGRDKVLVCVVRVGDDHTPSVVFGVTWKLLQVIGNAKRHPSKSLIAWRRKIGGSGRRNRIKSKLVLLVIVFSFFRV